MWWLVLGAWAGVVGEVSTGSTLEIVFDGDASGEVSLALDELRSGAFEAAGRRLDALTAAGGGAELWWLASLAWYEAGELARADEASREGLRLAPEHPSLGCLRGLILADRGRGDDALKALEVAERVAGSDAPLLARVLLNRARVHLDRGEPMSAASALARAEPLVAGDPSLQALLAEQRAELGALQGQQADTDALARIGDALSRGDLVGARRLVPAEGTDPRSRLHHAIAEGTVARAEGRLETARQVLTKAAADAATRGLVRERVAALGQLGVVYAASHRPEAARSVLEEALDQLQGGSLRVVELSYRVEAGRAALRAGDTAGAEAHLAQAKAASATVKDASASGRVPELQGMVAAARGDEAGAGSAFSAATAAYAARGAHADAARVSTQVIELLAGRDEAALAAEKERALALFSRIGDPLGPSHVGVAEGLGRAAHGDLEGAMGAFVAASSAAEAVGNDRGEQMAVLARENAAKVLANLTDSAVVQEQATKWGLAELVTRGKAFERGRAAYDAGLAEYGAGRYDAAQAHFATAVKELDALGETAWAAVARRSRAWAEFNAYTHADAASGFAVWQRLVEEGTLLGDAELRVRARVAGALAAGELGRPEAAKSLTAAASEAEGMGLGHLAGQCHAALAEHAPTLPEKVASARKALALRDGDPTGQYAMYTAALAAYESDDPTLALALCGEVRPRTSGELRAAVDEVERAARGALGE